MLQKADDPRAYYKRMGMAVPKGVPPSEQDVEKYSEFMLAAQGALREPPEEAKPVLAGRLEASALAMRYNKYYYYLWKRGD
jgi:hypothetical protein